MKNTIITLQRKFFYSFHGAILIYAGGLLSMNVAGYAQSITELARRVDSIEQLNVDRRLTIIETVLAENKNRSRDMFDYGQGGAIALILARLGYDVMKKEKPNANPN